MSEIEKRKKLGFSLNNDNTSVPVQIASWGTSQDIGTETSEGHTTAYAEVKALCLAAVTNCRIKVGEGVTAAAADGKYMAAGAETHIVVEIGERISSYGQLNITPLR